MRRGVLPGLALTLAAFGILPPLGAAETWGDPWDDPTFDPLGAPISGAPCPKTDLTAVTLEDEGGFVNATWEVQDITANCPIDADFAYYVYRFDFTTPEFRTARAFVLISPANEVIEAVVGGQRVLGFSTWATVTATLNEGTNSVTSPIPFAPPFIGAVFRTYLVECTSGICQSPGSTEFGDRAPDAGYLFHGI